MKVLLLDMKNQPIDVLDTKDLTAAEVRAVKNNRDGALSLRDLPGNKRDVA